jgi:putative FmdB family regulatory protein
MPTYEYRCENGHTIEAVQSFSDEPLTACPECGARLRRVFHPVGIVLKGSGFYATDNRSSKRQAGAAPSKKDETKTETAAPAKSDGASGSGSGKGSGSGSGSGGSSAQAS